MKVTDWAPHVLVMCTFPGWRCCHLSSYVCTVCALTPSVVACGVSVDHLVVYNVNVSVAGQVSNAASLVFNNNLRINWVSVQTASPTGMATTGNDVITVFGRMTRRPRWPPLF